MLCRFCFLFICVPARSMVMGLKGIAHDLAYLSNDDVETPSAMMGKKMVPILELGRPGSDEHEVSRAFAGGAESLLRGIFRFPFRSQLQ